MVIPVSQKLEQIFHDLGVEQNIDTFSERKRLQKLTYLIEVFGIDLGFKFSWYLHGPYNKNLTKVLYREQEAMDRPVQERFEREEEKINLLREFLGREIHSGRDLELIVSLHYLLTLARKGEEEDESAIERLRELKPFFSREEIDYQYRRITENIPI